MRNLRLIARLDVKGPNLIKGIQLEGLRKVGDPNVFARRYYEQGIDEIIYMDCVASLYGRNSLTDIVRHTARDVFIPVTVGGVRSSDDAARLLDSGADKVAVNTAALANPALIGKISQRFGSQCMVLSVEAKARSGGGWEAYHDNGREKTGRDVVEWVREAVDRGAGEVLITSVDREGTCQGFDCALVKAVTDAVSVPVIASGGMGRPEHLTDVLAKGQPDAVAMAHVLHFDKYGLEELRMVSEAAGRKVRHP